MVDASHITAGQPNDTWGGIGCQWVHFKLVVAARWGFYLAEGLQLIPPVVVQTVE